MSSLTLDDYKVLSRIPINDECSFMVDNEKYTIENKKPQKEVYAHITEWSTDLSTHHYGVLMCPHIGWDIGWIRVEHKLCKDPYSEYYGKVTYGEGPRVHGWGRMVVEITRVAEYGIMNFDHEGKRQMTVKPGERTNRFDDKTMLERRIKEEFARIFGEGYKLRWMK